VLGAKVKVKVKVRVRVRVRVRVGIRVRVRVRVRIRVRVRVEGVEVTGYGLLVRFSISCITFLILSRRCSGFLSSPTRLPSLTPTLT
jgi:hypothetical protein